VTKRIFARNSAPRLQAELRRAGLDADGATQPQKILLVRADGVGDALVCAPLVAALRDAGHELGAVLGSLNRDALAARAFARVHVLERIPWPSHGSTVKSRRIALAQVRAVRYDVALIASEEVEAYRFAREAGIPTRVGFVNGWEKPFKTLGVAPLLTHRLLRAASAGRAREHEAETLFRLGAAFVPEHAPTRELGRLRELILDDAPAPGRYVALQVSRKLEGSGLDAAAYVALARALAAGGHLVRLLGDDGALVRELATRAGVGGSTGLSTAAWKAHLAAARAVVTPDSGAAHVAGMLGIPCVDVFAPAGATVRDVARWRPWAAPYRAVVLDPTRSPEAVAASIAGAAGDLLAAAG
jgi:ADP-heptose:LPS heptosyltransferase